MNPNPIRFNCQFSLSRVTSNTKPPYLAIIRGCGRLTLNNPIVVAVHTLRRDRGPYEATGTVISSPSRKSSDYAVGKSVRITNFDGIVRLDLSGLPSISGAGTAKAAIKSLDS